MTRKVPKRAIPVLPKGCTPFKPDQLVRQTVRTELDRLDIYSIGDTIDDAIAALTNIKMILTKKYASTLLLDHPPIMMEIDGPEYEGPDSFVFYHMREETDSEVRIRLMRIASSKIAWFNKKNNVSVG